MKPHLIIAAALLAVCTAHAEPAQIDVEKLQQTALALKEAHDRETALNQKVAEELKNAIAAKQKLEAEKEKLLATLQQVHAALKSSMAEVDKLKAQRDADGKLMIEMGQRNLELTKQLNRTTK